jgi:L-seryl-tRNA(Ser) seleniumtransferase
MKKSVSLRAIPAVEKVLQSLGPAELPRPAVVAVVRRVLATLRSEKVIPDFDAVLARIRGALDDLRRSKIQPVINGTGIIVHTNLGRSPLGPAVVATLASIAANYNNLEYDLTGGERGSRAAYLEHNLALLCGAEAATVVNNCAAALILILRHFAGGERNEVILSRGELVQIGGGFRIPDILEASGARLREIGTTNKTALADYAKAIGSRTALILKVHRSNFFMSGFVESPSTEDIAALARKRRIPFVEDLGSGAMVATEKLAAIEHEPTPAEVLKRGVDLVCCSGDKLLGGPQAGLIAGRAKFVAALKREPFFRALRCDKLILAALQTTVDNYLHGVHASNALRARTELPLPVGNERVEGQGEGHSTADRPVHVQAEWPSSPQPSPPSEGGEGEETFALSTNAVSAGAADTLKRGLPTPVLEMLSLSNDELRVRARKIIAALAGLPLQATLGEGKAQIGGGTLPRSAIPSVTVDLVPTRIALPDFASRLRAATPPVLGYISGGRFKVDLRTVFSKQDGDLARMICAAL